MIKIIEFRKGQVWNKPKNELMLEFEKETGKNAVFRGVITGNFEYWLYNKNNKEIKPVEAPKEEFSIFPAKFLKPNQKLKEAMNKLISYKVNFLNPEGEDTKGKNFNKIIIDTICPACNSVLHCTDCFKFKKLEVTFMRFCHNCGVIFMFTCKYENKEEFREKNKFFVEHIYKKRRLDYSE